MSESPTIVLVPGYWLGGWAWDAVAARLRDQGFPVTQVTLPGLDSVETPRASITLEDHLDAVADIVRAADSPVVLVGHSGAGEIVTGVADRMPDAVAALVFVDSGPSNDGTVNSPDLAEDVTEVALPPWDDLTAAGSSIDGLDEATLLRFRELAVPEPAGPMREALRLHDEGRYAIPVTLVCSSFPSEQVRQLIAAGHPWFAELSRYGSVDLVDVITGHWPMWSKPDDTAAAIANAATA
ncbi:alpha/beta hydrolase [Planctomonas sp. JC2975]|uniref:alpha/beta fold hydrolase n=1 Tax=Planctomonas sp. JC2975 TaxID=2729626 RepID=UPI001475194B|nr:alpha/beta hydrolase [Planctomonas sp. JC2975]NNC11785.1 alpha/beta hydrolase [Planctomonas sp. JC2975]